MRRLIVVTSLLATFAPGFGASATRPEPPRLSLRAVPRLTGMTPVEIHFVAEIVGGDALDDFHCPAIEWNWDDGAKSEHEEDCAPYQPGDQIERIYSAHHVYVQRGTYNVTFKLRRATRSFAQASTTISIVGGER